jgi:hypothetical protein
VPVFGVTFHDVQSWFGVDVHWNGLVYADALYRLADATGEEQWRTIADGIVACGMQQQRPDGPWMGMYPDAVSVVRGDEEYTWWLNPNLIGLNTFELAGIPLDVTTTTVAQDGGALLRMTSSATVRNATATGNHLKVTLDYPRGETIRTIVGGGTKPSSVRGGDGDLAEVDNLEQADQGWRWLPDLKLLVVKQANPTDTATLEITL